MKEFLSTKLYDTNEQFDEKTKSKINRKMAVDSVISTTYLKTFRFVFLFSLIYLLHK